MNTIGVIGAKGMLGYAVSNYFASRGNTVVAISRDNFDIVKDPLEKLEQLLSDCNVVINCAGVIKPQIAKMPIEDVIRVNSIFPKNLALLCNRMNIKCFHITTDCVYTGAKGNYTENDFFDADDTYGMTKNAGESAKCMVLRTSIVGEENGQSRSLIEWAKGQRRKKVNGFVNHFWNGVTTVHLAEIIEKILDQYLYNDGVYHIHSPNSVSKKDLLEILNNVYDLNLEIAPAEAPQFCDRTMSSKYSLSKMLCTKTIQMQLFEMRDFFESINIPVHDLS
ncbi:MAG: SDR family oxidoreductase [Bacteroidota bacterium]|jgi:dTDP-4-dehydrorhamnose reductase